MTDNLPIWKRYAPPGAGGTAAELEFGGISEAEGWRRYNAAIEEVRELILASPYTNHDPQTRAEALAILPQIQAQAYLMAVAPRQDYPRFHIHEYMQPGVFTWNLPCPDFVYRIVFLDGRRTYRIHGERRTASWVNFQSYNSFSGVGTANPRRVGNWDLDDFKIEPDGSFEIIVSATPHEGNWIEIDGNSRNDWIMVRQLAYQGELPPSMHIETIGDGPPKVAVLDEQELGRRLALGGEIVKYTVTRMIHARLHEVILPQAGGTNKFHVISGKDDKESKDGTNPIADYEVAVYEIEPDEALIFEADPPRARYWNVHLGDILNQTRDYVNHCTSINDRQAVRDADGRVRVVLSVQDPGVPNWLDTVGSVYGRICWRWYGADRTEIPTIRRVKLADVRGYLPATTPVVSKEQRAREQRERRLFVSSMYGF